MKYRFRDGTTLDTDAFELRRGGSLQKVEPMVFDLIAHFAAHPRQVFTRDELMRSVWNGRVVSDSTVATCIKSARKALGDDGSRQQFIETVRNRGFRFVAEVATEERFAGADTSTADWQPTLLILPFSPISEDVQLIELGAQLIVELSTLLTRIPLLRISDETQRYSSRSPPPTARRIHDECGADYVVQSTLQRRGSDVDVNVVLIDAREGYRLWAESIAFDEASADVPLLASRFVSKLEPQIYLAIYKSIQVSDDALSAELLFLKAQSLLVAKGWHHESFSEAIALLKRVISREPNFALGHAMLSLLVGFGARVGLDTEKAAAHELVTTAANRALRIDGMDSTVLGFVGCSLADVGEIERGEALLRNALELNPKNAQAMVALGAVRLVQRDTAEGIRLLADGIELSPLDPRLSIWGALLAVAHLLVKDTDRAIETAELACRRNDQTYMPRVALAAARLAVGDAAGASRALEDARRIKPDLDAAQIAALVGQETCKHLLDMEK